MANKSKIENNKKRQRLVARDLGKRQALKKVVMDKTLTMNERFQASQEFSKLSRNGAKVRIRNRCQICGRPRGYSRKFQMSRIWLRQLASQGYLAGVVKSSW